MGQKRILLGHLFILAIFACVLFSLHVPVLDDYPNHLARMYLYYHLPNSPLAEFYYSKFELVPYLAMDGFFLISQHFFDIYTTGQLFILLCVGLTSFAVLHLSKTIHGQYESSSFLIYLTLFNYNFASGFLNYYLSIPFTILFFSLWVRYENSRYRLPLFFLLSQIIFFIHIFAFFILLFVIAVCEFQKNNFKLKPTITTGLKLLPCLIMPVAVSALTADSLDLGIQKFTRFGNVSDKIHTFASPFYFNDMALALGALALVVVAYFNKTLIIPKHKFLPLLLIAVCPLIPQTTNGIFQTDVRLPIIAVIILFTISKLNTPNREVKTTKFILIAFTAFITMTYSAKLDRADDIAAKYIENIKFIEPQAKVFTIHSEQRETSTGLRFTYVEALGMIENKFFFPNLINATPPIRTKKAYAPISVISGAHLYDDRFVLSQQNPAAMEKELGKNFYWKNWQNDFDYVDYFHHGHKINLGEKINSLPVVYEDNFHTVYKVKNEVKP